MFLLSKSENSASSYNIKEFKDKIETWYEKLNEIPEISTIFRVISARYSGLEKIVFDFTKESVIGICADSSHNIVGLTDYEKGRIYVGAKGEEDEVLGTLAHEIAHFAMQIVYRNEYKPYSKSQVHDCQEFENIVQDIVDKQDLDPIIKRAFENYKNEFWHSELIVRVPHLLAKHGNEKGRKLLEETEQTKNLLKFFEIKVDSSCKQFIKEQHLIFPRHNVELLSPFLGVLDGIRNLPTEFETPIDMSKFLELENKENFFLIETENIMISGSHVLQTLTSTNLNPNSYLFLSNNQFKNEIFDIFKTDAINLLVMMFPDDVNQSKENDLFKDFHEILSRKPNKKIIFMTKENSVSAKLLKEKLPNQTMKLDDKFTWSDLTLGSQKKLLKK
jgi:hypothetical protein